MRPALPILVVALLALCWATRWQMTPIGGVDQANSGVYMLNRWTGALYLVTADQRIKVEDAFWQADTPAPAPAK